MNKCRVSECPGCRLRLPDDNLGPGDRFNASGECLKLFQELTCWTLTRHDNRFIHQHAVDAYEAQHAGGITQPIMAVFGLAGLYLAIDKGFTGRQVQLAHMKMGRTKHDWPRFEPPEVPAQLTVLDVVEAETDHEKEEMLMRWAASVWGSWEPRHREIRVLTEKLLYSGDK